MAPDLRQVCILRLENCTEGPLLDTGSRQIRESARIHSSEGYSVMEAYKRRVTNRSRQWLRSIVLVIAIAVGRGAYPQALLYGQGTLLTPVVDALRNRDFQRALRLSKSILEKAPKDYRLWTLEGFAYSGGGNLDSALLSYDRALALYPDYVPALEGASQIEYSRGSSHARSLLDHLLVLRPTEQTAHAMLAVMEYKAGNCNAAIEHFRGAGQILDSQPVALTQYGSCLTKSHRDEEAYRVFIRIVSLEPEDESARYNLAVAEMNFEMPQEALETLQTLIASGRANMDVLTLAANVEEENGNSQRAVDLLRQAILEHSDVVDGYLQFAVLASNHESYQVGIDVLTNGLARLPKAAQLHLARGVLYAQLGKLNDGIQDFEAANQLDPTLSFVGTAEGIADAQRHNDANALSMFRANARRHPNDALSQYLLAEAISNEGKSGEGPEYREELDAATRAFELDPSLTAAGGLLETLSLQSGNTNLAIQYCEAALRADPTNQQALYHLILALRTTERRGEISDLTKRLLELREAERNQAGKKKRFQVVEAASPSMPPVVPSLP